MASDRKKKFREASVVICLQIYVKSGETKMMQCFPAICMYWVNDGTSAFRLIDVTIDVTVTIPHACTDIATATVINVR